MKENHSSLPPHHHHSLESTPVWYAGYSMPATQKLTEDKMADVCVVGGGIAGLTTAYLLSRESQKVILLEDAYLGAGQTGRTTAQFTTLPDTPLRELERLHGLDNVKRIIDAHIEAINMAEDIILDEGIACDLTEVDGYLFNGHPGSGADRRALEKEAEILEKIHFQSFERIPEAPLPFKTGPALKLKQQLQIHPLKYISGLASAFLRNGGEIYTNTHVDETHSGEGAYVRTRDGHHVHAKNIVIATHSPINDIVAIHTKQTAWRSYVIAFRIPHGALPYAQFWDTADPFHFVRLTPDPNAVPGEPSAYDVLLVGGADHRTGQREDPYESYLELVDWTLARFPLVEDRLWSWSGQWMRSFDGLPFLGRNPMDYDNVFVLTGDGGNGMTSSTIGGRLVTDLILGRTNRWEDLYNPGRFTLSAVGNFIRDGLNETAQYKDWIYASSPFDLPHLERGEGLVMTEGLGKTAVYKDHDGELHKLSAVCPHLGGIVRWNTAEKSWDCPCHGSRFDPQGHVIEGPACTNLQPKEGLKKIGPRVPQGERPLTPNV